MTTTTTRTERNASADLQSSQQAAHGQSEESRRSVSQLQTNRLWEATQAVIAVSITWTILYVCIQLALGAEPEASRSALLLLNAAFVMVVSLYLQRTNHTKTSTAGKGPDER